MIESPDERIPNSALTPRRRDFLKASIAGVSTALGAPAITAIAAEETSLPVLGPAPQLFVDRDRVEELDNVRQVFHEADKHPANPLLRKEKRWEEAYGTWGTVIHDDQDGLFKVWYGGTGSSTGDTRPGFRKTKSVLCYATSKDGIHWRRPELGLHALFGSKRNNVVVGEDYHNGLDHWESILKDPTDSDPQRRYKGIGWSSNDWTGPMSGIYTMVSPDGLNWTHTPEPVFRYHPRPNTDDLGPVGDAQSMMIDTLAGRYVAFLRKLPNRAMSVSTDFIHWTAPKVCLKARPGEKVNTVYNHKGFVYGDQYLGYLTYFDRNPKNPLLTVRLLSSRDGNSWQRPTDLPLIDVGGPGESDRFVNMLTGGPPIRVEDKLYLYYRILARRHSPYEGLDEPPAGSIGGIGLATLRIDGFASLSASYDGGRVTTKPFRFAGSRLLLNAKADFGSVSVEALDQRGEPIPGFARADCRPTRSDSLDAEVHWKRHANLDPLKRQPIRLRFHLENARLFSYRIV